jgi:hypothetical protein
LQEFLSPAPGAAVALLTGRDDIGRPLEGNVAARLRDTLVAPAALSSLARAAAKDHEGPGGDLFRNIFGSRTATKTFPDSNDAYWRFLFGGIYPRTYDKKALARNAALEKSGR